MAKVSVVMGSKSDWDVVKKTVTTLKGFGVEVEVRIISAHRTPNIAHEFASKAKSNNVDVIIACAGKAAHLGGVIAAYTTLPVIGLPIKSSTMDGLDSLLSIVQMPSGIPVATVAINGAENAAILAVQMIALKDEKLSKKLEEFKINMEKKIIEEDRAFQEEIK